nr:hypothetical protein [Tanacetum cinerariifolium]
AILKRRREEDDDQEGPSAGSDRGSKRRREGGEHASASTPSEPATGSAGRCFKPKIHNIYYKDKGGRLWAHKFYGFTVNRESALDVYSKRRIIAVTDLKIVEWHNYKHLDWISDVYEEYRHSAACGRSSTGSRKLPEDAQPYKARHVSIRFKATRSVYCLFEPKRIYLSKQGQEKQVDADR